MNSRTMPLPSSPSATPAVRHSSSGSSSAPAAWAVNLVVITRSVTTKAGYPVRPGKLCSHLRGSRCRLQSVSRLWRLRGREHLRNRSWSCGYHSGLQWRRPLGGRGHPDSGWRDARHSGPALGTALGGRGHLYGDIGPKSGADLQWGRPLRGRAHVRPDRPGVLVPIPAMGTALVGHGQRQRAGAAGASSKVRAARRRRARRFLHDSVPVRQLPQVEGGLVLGDRVPGALPCRSGRS